MSVRKTIRALQFFTAVAAVLVLAIVVCVGCPCRDFDNCATCPYCHASVQPAIQAAPIHPFVALVPFISLPIPADSAPQTAPVLSQTSSRAPPVA